MTDMQNPKSNISEESSFEEPTQTDYTRLDEFADYPNSEPARFLSKNLGYIGLAIVIIASLVGLSFLPKEVDVQPNVEEPAVNEVLEEETPTEETEVEEPVETEVETETEKVEDAEPLDFDLEEPAVDTDSEVQEIVE